MRSLLWLLLSSVTLATNLADFNMFAKHWLVPDCGWCRGYDYSGDGDVDLVDLSIFAERWLDMSQIQVIGATNPTALNGVYELNDIGAYVWGTATISKIDLTGSYRWEIRLVTDLYFTSETFTDANTSPIGLEYTEFGDGTGTVTVNEYNEITINGDNRMLTYSSRYMTVDGNTPDRMLTAPYLIIMDYNSGNIVNATTGVPSADDTYATGKIAGSAANANNNVFKFLIPPLVDIYEYAFRICEGYSTAAKTDASVIGGFLDPKTLATYGNQLSQGKLRIR